MTIRFKDCTFTNCNFGFVVNEGGKLIVENTTFDNVRVPFAVKNARSLDVSGTKILNDPKLLEYKKNTSKTSSGWRRIDGPPLPVFCPNCKTIFPSNNYVFAGLYFNLWNNKETCPECLFDGAQLSEGVFNLSQDTIRIISAPDITYAMLKAIAEFSQEVLAKKQSARKIIEAAELKVPTFAPLLKKALMFGYAGIMFVATIASLYYAREQTNIARQAAQSPPVSTSEPEQQRRLEDVLSRLENLPGNGQDSRNRAVHRNVERNPGRPAQRKAQPKS